MDINVFATDMDGAFLTDANDYDRQRFAHVFEVLQAQGKRFVAISGNQSTKSKDFSKTTLTR
ncbi:HAD hydrolase family protein [Streptococcus dysgalactiae]|uniref:HAD hydrolase family protein n=1 Tax=Streptococcus dysgalactiae TaxID=1334 RepID=UPI000806FD70|nr:HAD hydrolase family protein [Streptococcus dysgalactiae]OBY97917.1 phosphatase [Streptococcus dysgalactiae subsp. equisimilis]OBZ04887.1 phosphatase [Streptococcus dysgalactiae subsp. equisimilis]VTS31200.1 phosphatase [Streptococcus dysgalactiae subsp. equisimilis]